MTQIIKYICPTKISAFNLIDRITREGGKACMVKSDNKPTRCVLSDYDCDKNMESFCYLGIISNWAECWDVEYFKNSMK